MTYFFQVGTSAGALSFEDQKSSFKESRLGVNSVSLDKDIQFREDAGLRWTGYGNLYLVSLAEDTLQMMESIQGTLLGFDENLNIYTQIFDEKIPAIIIRKYNNKGTLVSKFDFWLSKPYVDISAKLSGGIFLDREGNIYFFCESFKDGIKVTKWSKQ